MIDLNKAKQVFLEYVKAYDETNPRILRKKMHTLRTSDVAIKIASGLNLNEEDIQLAGLIGLLHDLGRFNQVKIYNTYRDSISINHAEESNRVLFEEGYIRKYIEEDKFDDIIRTAIWNHNKAAIEEGLDERTLLHAKIIRDADKTDIFETFEHEEAGKTLYNYEELGQDSISDKVFNEFMNCRQIDRSMLETRLEWYLSMLSYTFDYNFTPGLEIIKERDYIGRMIARIKNRTEENEKKLNEIQEIILNYIDNSLNA